MQPTHTPGPWNLSDETNPLITNDSGSVDIAQVFMYSEGTTGSLRPDAYANAHLIAAAPDLLATLRELVRYVRDEFSCSHPLCEAADRARAAIARAVGMYPDDI